MAQAFLAFTVDVEEWFHAHALAISQDRWDDHPSRIDAPLEFILNLLDQSKSTGTFFVLGYVASKRPELIRQVDAAGHEIASHGFWHRRADTQSINEFSDDVRRSKDVLEDAIGQKVRGFRAPSYSLNLSMSAHFEVLAEAGYRYDSSVYPITPVFGRYGDATCSRAPFMLPSGLIEFPLPTLRAFGTSWPIATGAYLRLAPLGFTTWSVQRSLQRGMPVVLNIHPWELDANQPRAPCRWLTRCRHYTGLATMKQKLTRLLALQRAVSLREKLAEYSSGTHRDIAHVDMPRQDLMTGPLATCHEPYPETRNTNLESAIHRQAVIHTVEGVTP